MAKRQAKTEEEKIVHTYLAIQIESYEASVGASINLDLRVFPPHFADNDDPMLEYVTSLDISGISVAPKERAGDMYQITIRGDEGRNREIPGIATLGKRRGEKVWDA